MTAKLNINSLLDPQLLDALQNLKLDITRTLNCVKIGSIQRFDGTTKTAQIQILFKRVLNDGSIADYPVLVDCPVFTLQGGGGAIQFPIAPGDNCILLFSDRNIDAWFQNGSAAAPFDARCHDLSDGIALVGINSIDSSLDGYQANIARIFYDGAQVAVTAGGLVKISNQLTTLLALLNGLIDVVAASTLDVSHATLSAGTIAALEAYKLQMAELLL